MFYGRGVSDPGVTISNLIPVNIRSVWPTEPHDFTPWLLDNSELLSDTLGLQIELEDREHSVGAFSLDLIGTVIGSEQVVIVENQFGPTDHTHLGQIMTYAGGTAPAVIIWIAESFREEHRAALDWLNLNTPTDIKFFGVALGAVRMKDGAANLVAPRLDLVCKPNDWEKLARQDAASGGGDGVSPRNALYKQFWTKFEEAAKERGWTNGTAPAANWWTLSTTKPGYSWTVSFMQGGCRSELYIDTGDKLTNEFLASQLAARQPQLSDAFGEGEVLLQYLPDNKACRLETRLAGPVITDRDVWDEVLAWLVDTQVRLRAAVSATGGLPVGVPPEGWLPPYAMSSDGPSQG